MLGLGLDANAIWLLDVATNNCPENTNCEDESSKVAYECIALVHAAMKELERHRQDVVNLKCCGDTEQHQEPEVDHGVHHSCRTITKKSAHVDAGTIVSKTTLHVLRGCLATVWRTAFPVTNAICESE